jgi:hypothetical protein
MVHPLAETSQVAGEGTSLARMALSRGCVRLSVVPAIHAVDVYETFANTRKTAVS